MAKQKKNGGQEKTLQILLLTTAVVNLIRAIFDLLERFLE